MSLILSFYPPESLYTNPLAHTCVIFRNSTCIASNAPWTMYEDVDNNVSTNYTVKYYDNKGREVASINNEDIETYERLPNTCRIEFEIMEGRGRRAKTKSIVVGYSDGNETTVITNGAGIGYVFALYGERVLINAGGGKYKDCVVPAVRSVKYEELEGVFIAAERRGRQ